MTKQGSHFDVIVVGAGHAGIEACLATSRSGLKTLMVTSNLNRIGFMSCNPSIGGLAKGHMVRELDVLGGEMGAAADATCIQFKRLNAGKGPAVRGSRAQCDKDLYSSHMTDRLKTQENLEVFGGEVKSLILEKDNCVGIILGDKSEIRAKAVIITTGTFMNGIMHVGQQSVAGGRVGDSATSGLSDQLASFGFTVHRLKTGTPPRLAAGSIDWSKTAPQCGDKVFWPFSLRSERNLRLPQVTCYLGYTNAKTHEIIQKNLNLSPMYSGLIEGVGPRYCPSIEDKVTRFADRDRHQTFLEPEGLLTDSIYLQGISTSLPTSVQDEFLKTIDGLENVKVIRYGYAVEYDFIEPTQIWHSLETRGIKNLFLAGQINGTSGYEEAAVQGFIAGINAVKKIRAEEPLILGRDQAYIGVLIDDLVTKGTREPYRMFTSRAEHRLMLREDNTVERLFDLGRRLHISDDKNLLRVDRLKNEREELWDMLKTKKVVPNAETQEKLKKIDSPVLTKPLTLECLLRRSELSFLDLSEFTDISKFKDPEIHEAVEIQVKYSGYIFRQQELIVQARRLEGLRLEPDIKYEEIRGLSTEEVEKLKDRKPISIGHAQRISGVNPSAIQAILVYIKGRKKFKELTVD
ncbi:MAG: tRNA uridine-5-carboxymethylaminomethyl(34) synthesis enzyme MnmG [Pseudomonadota bacterium]|nr:tRNA uridine-5-carboxymethylaminomethyl(34) synthesis enzyme MnmG [Pseudomonadota bacterium]